MFPFPDVVHLFPDKLTRLRAGRFSLFFVALGAFDDLLLWHRFLLNHHDTAQIAAEHGRLCFA
jgi:hypothetical protein